MCNNDRSYYKPDSSSAWKVCLMASPAGHESLSVVASSSTITSFSGAKEMHPFAASYNSLGLNVFLEWRFLKDKILCEFKPSNCILTEECVAHSANITGKAPLQ